MDIAKLPVPGSIKVILKCVKERGSKTEASGVCGTSIEFQQNIFPTEFSDHAPQRPRQDRQDSSVAGVCWRNTHISLSSCWIANCYRPGVKTIVGRNGVNQPAPRLTSAV